MKISALILTHNEEKMLKDCLKQLNFVDEIIVLDQASTDQTVDIAKIYANKVVSASSEDFAKNRQLLAESAKGKWLLYIDADERLNSDNVQEIKTALKTKKYAAYFFARKNIILGKWLKHGGWWPDLAPRLFQKDKLLGWQGSVHESPIVQGEFGYFTAPIVHFTAQNISSMLAKTTKWAQIEARLFYSGRKNPTINILRVAKSLVSEFTSRFFGKLGFLDGQIGLIESIYQALHRCIILVYLWELQNGSEKKSRQVKGK